MFKETPAQLEQTCLLSLYVTAERTAYVSRRRRGERLVHSTLDGQFDVISVHRGLLGVCGVDLGVLDDGRHVSCEQRQRRDVNDAPREQKQACDWLEASSLTVGELQHLVDDSGLVLGDAHVLQDLDHHLQHSHDPTWCHSRFSHQQKNFNIWFNRFRNWSHTF